LKFLLKIGQRIARIAKGKLSEQSKYLNYL
jgi:hypothetical protein